MARGRRKGPFQGVPMGGLGDHVGNPARYRIEPGNTEMVEAAKALMKKDVQSLPSRKVAMDAIEALTEDYLRTLPLYRTFPIPAKYVEVTLQLVGTTCLPLDVGISNRKDICIANMSDQIVWIAPRTMPATGQGIPLAANSAAGKYDGGKFAMDAAQNVRWYGIAPAGSNLVVIIESAA